MPSRAERRAERQKQVADYKSMSRKDRRKARKAGGGGGGKGKKAEGKEGPWGPPLGGGAPFDNDPNTMFSYYNAPQTFDFNDYQQYGGMPGDFNDPYNAYLSAVPEMQRQTQGQISDALSAFGQGGNRYSSAAMSTAANIGAQSAERQNAMLSDLLFQQTQRDLDRQMQAAQGYIAATPQVEQGFQNRFNTNFRLAQQEQQALEAARAHQLARERMSYADFEKNRYGNLPFLTQFLSNGIGQGPEPILNQQAGKPGWGTTIMQGAQLGNEMGWW